MDARGRAVLEALRWSAGAFLSWRVPALDGRGAPTTGDRVSVVVPARDEATRLPALLRSLPAAGPPEAEVVVVDDGSSDPTAAVAAGLGARVVAAGPLPAGWTGKSWACAVGARAAAGDVLVFLDADTELAPGALGALVAELGAMGGGLVSVAPHHLAGRGYERLSLLCNLVSAMGTGAFSPLGGVRAAGAFGPCMACRRVDYEAAGGHAGVRGEVAEDVALGEAFRAAGLPVRLLAGGGAVSYRMYPGGPAQFLEGWSKNLALGAGAAPPWALALAVLWVSGLLEAAGRAGVALWGRRGRRRRAAGRAAAVGIYVGYGAQVEWLGRRWGSFGRGTGLAYPLPLGAFLACLGRSLWLVAANGRVPWRGRLVEVRGR